MGRNQAEVACSIHTQGVGTREIPRRGSSSSRVTVPIDAASGNSSAKLR